MRITFLKFIRAVSMTALFLSTILRITPLHAQETTRLGIWVVRDQLTSTAKIDRMIAQLSAEGVSDIFVQVRGRGDALYASELVPFSELITEKYFDPLRYVLRKAHEKNLRVHAWMNMFLLWSAEDPPRSYRHILNRYPEWTGINVADRQDGFCKRSELLASGTEGVFLSPFLPDVTEHLKAVIEEVIENYEVDGIHLDYVRYPNDLYDYNEYGRAKFREEFGIDPFEIRRIARDSASVSNGVDMGVYSAAWDQFRRDAISDFLRQVKLMLVKNPRTIALSAAVKPDIDRAADYYFQDWVSWVRNGWIDMVMPMNYVRSTNGYEANIQSILARELAPEKVWMGIGAYNETRLGIMTKTMVARYRGFRQLIYFSYESFLENPEYFSAIREALNTYH